MKSPILFVSAAVLGLSLFCNPIAMGDPLNLQLSIRSDEKVGTARVLRAKQGDQVVIEWTTDKPVIVHIHPYDIEQKVAPDAPARTEFTAKISGRFPIEAHFASQTKDKVVAYLEVLPR